VARIFRDLLEAVIVSRRVDRDRRLSGPLGLLPRLRTRGAQRLARSAADRARLQHIVRLVDRCFPSGPNCYRRALTEIAMDAGAATERLHMGINARDGESSGHAWLESSADRGDGYDAEFCV
jgi:hypothetical protein